VLEDVEGALSSQSNVDKNRIQLNQLPPLNRMSPSIPAVSSTENSDETGIVVAGLGDDDRFYILDDVSGVMLLPEIGRQAISLHHARRADRIIGEKNNGGDLMESTLRQVGAEHSLLGGMGAAAQTCRARCSSKTASRWSGVLLEDQLTLLTTDFSAKELGLVRIEPDAAIYAITELSENGGGARPVWICI
jgi:phage terminase large subunit-like protein